MDLVAKKEGQPVWKLADCRPATAGNRLYPVWIPGEPGSNGRKPEGSGLYSS